MPSLEESIGKVLLSESSKISEGTEELKVAFKSPDIVPGLCQVLGTSQKQEVRQYAVVLLRKHLQRKKHWMQLKADVKKGLKDGLLQALISEPTKSVKSAIAQLMGVIAKHLKQIDRDWPELLQFFQNFITNNDPEKQEIGTLALKNVLDTCSESMANFMPAFCILFKHVLETNTNLASDSVFNTIIGMKHLIPELSEQKACVSAYANLLPKVMEAAAAMAAVDEDKAVEELGILDDLLEENASVIGTHLQFVISACTQMAINSALPDAVRVKGTLLAGWVGRSRKKAFLKQGLLQPTLEALFNLMSAPTSMEEEEEAYFTANVESTTPQLCASQTLDTLALSLPPDKLIPVLATFIEPALQGDNVYRKKAAYLSLSVIAEGCTEYIRTNCLENFVQCIGKGITDQSTVVRNAALFALGQYSEYLQPEITKYAPLLMPILFTYLEQLCVSLQSSGKEPAGVDRMFYALETFCEQLNDDLIPYLPTLMERLLMTLDPRFSIHLRELALSAIGSTAMAAKKNILPYFPHIIEVLKTFLIVHASEDDKPLQVQALDTLAILGRNIGEENFRPLAWESLNLGIQLVKSSGDDADLRKASYGLFASISTVLKGEMSASLQEIVPFLLQSIKSKEGIVTHFKEDADKVYPVYDEVKDELEEDLDAEFTDDEEVCSDIVGYDLKNDYTEESEEACLALKEIAAEVGEAFTPYLKESFTEVYSALNYPHQSVKCAALGAAVQIILNWSKIPTPDAAHEVDDIILSIVPKAAELVHCDPDYNVVMASLEVYSDLLKELKGIVLKGEGHKEAIINCVKAVLMNETECQKQEGQGNDNDQEDDEDDGENDAEQDMALFEYASEVLNPLGHAMPNDDFGIVFRNLLPILINKTKKKCTAGQRSFSTGIIAECMEPLGVGQIPLVANQLLPLLLKLAQDKVPDVRNNSIFALGELAFHGKDALFPHYAQILQVLSTVISKNDNGPQVLDNICGAIARLIVTNVSAVPLDQVVPVFMMHLPLREDHGEIKPVFDSISCLYQMGAPQLANHIDKVILTAADVVGTDKVTADVAANIVELIKCIQRDFPDKFAATVSSLAPEVSARLQQAFSG
ncbi:importin-4-like [Neocloeon triangulifer]|uniref:importin-4-like n=1 Tax=Neocloeon triangulifer TaxID=2078957 RepID=UPI00286F037F|nr:importin-4-like [Neocloeon triangulifer]